MLHVRQVEPNGRGFACLARLSHAANAGRRDPIACRWPRQPAVDDPTKRAEFVSLIRGEADRLGTGIHRLLRLARGEAHRPPRGPVDVTEWAHATAERWRPRLAGLRVAAPDRLWAEIDPDKLDEAVEALLDNALRYGVGRRAHDQRDGQQGRGERGDGGTGLSEAARTARCARLGA
jgi:signal transduction histidine kinase